MLQDRSPGWQLVRTPVVLNDEFYRGSELGYYLTSSVWWLSPLSHTTPRVMRKEPALDSCFSKALTGDRWEAPVACGCTRPGQTLITTELSMEPKGCQDPPVRWTWTSGYSLPQSSVVSCSDYPQQDKLLKRRRTRQ